MRELYSINSTVNFNHNDNNIKYNICNRVGRVALQYSWSTIVDFTLQSILLYSGMFSPDIAGLINIITCMLIYYYYLYKILLHIVIIHSAYILLQIY